MKAYPAYKDSGFEWIGQIPSHWRIVRNKHLFREVETRSESGDELLLSLTKSKGLVPQSEVFDKGASAETLVGYRLCEPGQMVMNRLQAWNGMFGIVKERGLVSPDYSVLKLITDANLNFLFHLFKTSQMISVFRQRSRGIGAGFFRLYFPDFGDIHVPFPARAEQDAIVAFLEAKLAEIDRYIAQKERLIELLQEQKTALINQAVTRGLNPQVGMKDSGIEWLGEIPEHWQAVPLKHLAHIQTGITLGKVYSGVELCTFPYLRVANVQDGYFDLSEVKTVDVPEREAKGSMLKAGDLLVTEGGDFDKLGRGFVWNGEIENCLHQNHIFCIRPSEKLEPHFLAALLASSHGRTYFILTSKQTTNLASTNSTTLKEFDVLLPDRQEQKAILEYIAQQSKPIDQAIERAKNEIGLIQEYRTALIAEAVTGKIDVRS